MSKIVVTGGAGFIGSHIVDGLLSLGHEVSVVDDLSSGTLKNLPKNIKLEKLDIRSPEAREFLKSSKPDAVVHAAAQMSVRLSMDDPSFDTHVNVFGLINLLQAFHGERLPYFAFLSTGGAIYGEQDCFPAAENHAIRPASVYGLSKYAAELYLDLWQRQFGLKFAALRLGNVYGPRQSPHGEAGVVAIFYERLFRGETPVINGDGTQTRDFVFVKDVASAVIGAIEGRVSGVYNIGTGVETSVNELYKKLEESSGVNRAAKYGQAKAGEQARSSIDSRKAKQSFGWTPSTTLAEGLKTTAEFFRSTNPGK